MQLVQEGTQGSGAHEQQAQLLVCQLTVECTEKDLLEAFASHQAPLAHVYLSAVPLQERIVWCLGYAFCTLQSSSDLPNALRVAKVSVRAWDGLRTHVLSSCMRVHAHVKVR